MYKFSSFLLHNTIIIKKPKEKKEEDTKKCDTGQKKYKTYTQ